MGLVFLMTDAQVAEEKFLVVINDCLASGEIPELFADDEIDNLVNSVRAEVGIIFCKVHLIQIIRSHCKLSLFFQFNDFTFLNKLIVFLMGFV